MTDQEQQDVERITRDIAREISDAVAVGAAHFGTPRLGFALLVFDFGDTGTMAYASNADRQDMIRALDECRRKLIEGTQ